MATYGRKLLDDTGNVILPFTRSKFVYMEDNTTLEDSVSNINNALLDLRGLLTNINNQAYTFNMASNDRRVLPYEYTAKTSGIAFISASAYVMGRDHTESGYTGRGPGGISLSITRHNKKTGIKEELQLDAIGPLRNVDKGFIWRNGLSCFAIVQFEVGDTLAANIWIEDRTQISDNNNSIKISSTATSEKLNFA